MYEQLFVQISDMNDATSSAKRPFSSSYRLAVPFTPYQIE